MSAHRFIVWMFALSLVGCSSTRVVRLDSGQGTPEVHVPFEEEDAGPVELDDDEFEEALVVLARDVRPFEHPLREARERFGVPERSGVYEYQPQSLRLIRRGDEDIEGSRLLETYADDELTLAYGRWCERKSQPGDCLRLLEEGPLLGSDGKYSLALAIAMDTVWEETAEALEDMTDPGAVMATLTASVTMYLLLWSLPEPVSKGLAALLTATAIAYLGVDTVWRVLDGWVVLVREADRARSFEELSAVGEAYGEVLGENAARVFVMLATAAIGSTAGLAAKASGLPGSAQAAVAVEAQAGYRYTAVGGVRSVAMSAEGFTVALTPHAVAMASSESRSGRTEKHHLATNKNSKSAARGGPWTPRFERLFKRAGMELKDPENIVRVEGHKGPHPEAYHERVLGRLREALADCRRVDECREALTRTLRQLGDEVATKGTELNTLITRGR